MHARDLDNEIDCLACDNDGVDPYDVPCEVCDRTGTLSNPCPECGGDGRVFENVQTDDGLEAAARACSNCDGTGALTETCPDCDGHGDVNHDCRLCGGAGSVNRYGPANETTTADGHDTYTGPVVILDANVSQVTGSLGMAKLHIEGPNGGFNALYGDYVPAEWQGEQPSTMAAENDITLDRAAQKLNTPIADVVDEPEVPFEAGAFSDGPPADPHMSLDEAIEWERARGIDVRASFLEQIKSEQQ